MTNKKNSEHIKKSFKVFKHIYTYKYIYMYIYIYIYIYIYYVYIIISYRQCYFERSRAIRGDALYLTGEEVGKH